MLCKSCLFACLLAVLWCSSPESLSGRLPLWTLAQVADVIEREEEAVPGGGEPGEGEGGVKLLEGQLGQLGGARPGRAHAHHHGDSPQGLAHLYGSYSDAAVEPPSAGAGLCSRSTTSWLCVCGAHHILPGAVFSCRQTDRHTLSWQLNTPTLQICRLVGFLFFNIPLREFYSLFNGIKIQAHV